MTSDDDQEAMPALDNASLRNLEARYAALLAAQAALIEEVRRRTDTTARQPAQEREPESDADADTDPSKGRVEALSDGVFAVAITLLILDVHVPEAGEIAARGIWEALGERWPNYLGFFLSFLLVGLVWANHRTMFSFIRRVDPTLVLLNTLLLLNIVTLPFCTALLTTGLALPAARQAGLLVYTGALAIGGVLYNLLWWHAAHRRRLLVRSVSSRTVRTLTRNYALGPTLYTVAFVLALMNAIASLVLCVALVLLYLTPGFVHRFRRRG